MFIKNKVFLLAIDNDGYFLLSAPKGDNDDPHAWMEVETNPYKSYIGIDFWNRRGFELECYPCSEYDKFIASFYWGAKEIDFAMKVYRNKWGIPRLVFSNKIYD